MKCWIWRNIFLVTSILVNQRSLTGMQHNVVKCQPLHQDSSPSLATSLACDLAWITSSPCFSPYPAMKYLFYPLKYRGKHPFHVLFSVLACQRLMTLFLTTINFFVLWWWEEKYSDAQAKPKVPKECMHIPGKSTWRFHMVSKKPNWLTLPLIRTLTHHMTNHTSDTCIGPTLLDS